MVMKSAVTDIDIDVPDRDKVLALFPHVVASIHKNGSRAHNTGVYFHDVPVDPLTNRCTMDYQEAEASGFFKIDILNVGLYKQVRDLAHLDSLLEREPIWELLEEKEFCDLLFHIKGHHSICQKMKPRNVEQLAAVLAMIRPAKRHLVGRDWDTVNREVWKRPDNDDYYFKKSHAIGYAMAVKMHMNLLVDSYAADKSTGAQ